MVGLIGGARPAVAEQRLVRVAPVEVELPLGYWVTFSWPGSLQVGWRPRKPLARTDARLAFSMTWDRFYRAYRGGRRDFLQVVANELGSPVTVIDQRGPEVVRPNRVH